LLAARAEHEIADRGRRRIECHLAEARLLVGKTFDSFGFDPVPVVSKAQMRRSPPAAGQQPSCCCSDHARAMGAAVGVADE
jgi:hypothetical protein